MKRVRIMLMTIAVVALVGGALAFKASKMYNADLCTTTTTGTCPALCPTFIAGTTVEVGTPAQNIVCTTTANAALPNTPCSYRNPQNQLTTITCSTDPKKTLAAE